MFRLKFGAFDDNEKLRALAVTCLTETIKSQLEEYFASDYKSETDENLHKKVILEEVYELFPEELLHEMELAGIQLDAFISKKMAQFMLLLNKKDVEIPDIFIEYILAKMIEDEKETRVIRELYEDEEEDIQTKDMKVICGLKTALIEYFKDDFDNEDELNLVVNNHVLLLTDFASLLGIEEPDDESFAFWDWDYAFFDNWGFDKTIQHLAYGVLALHGGYGVEYTNTIFTSVGEEVPRILKSLNGS